MRRQDDADERLCDGDGSTFVRPDLNLTLGDGDESNRSWLLLLELRASMLLLDDLRGNVANDDDDLFLYTAALNEE